MARILPHELSDRVIDFLHDDILSLSACSLTCRSWLPAARYHRWSATRILAWDIQQFSALLDASSGLASFVTSLDVRGNTVPLCRQFPAKQVDVLLRQLPSLQHLSLRCWVLTDQVANMLAANETFRASTGLSIASCIAPSMDTMALLLTTPCLSTISLEDVILDDQSPWEPPRAQLTPHSLSLAGLCLRLPEASTLLRWLCEARTVEQLVACIRHEDEATAMAVVLSSLSGSLLELDLSVDADASLSAVFGASSFALDCLPNLQVCRLDFSLREMCVPGNSSLAWVTTLLGQLASLYLQEILISVKADNMVDLRALDSECGVRTAHSVQYADLTALDWAVLEHSMFVGRLPPSTRIVVVGTGTPTTLLSYMQGLYPTIAQNLHFRSAVQSLL